MPYKDYNKKLDYAKKYYQLHKKEIRIHRKEYLRKNREKIKEKRRNYFKKYFKTYRKKYTDYYREYRKTHKEQTKNSYKKYQKTHKEKIREYCIKHKYNLTKLDFNNLLLAQNNRCAICNESLDLTNTRNIHIDHNHKTKKIRGILCQKCNQAIGLLRDNPEYAYNASIYLESD